MVSLISAVVGFVKNPSNQYIGLWCAYLLQGTLYPEGSVLSQTILLYILLISLYDTKEMYFKKGNTTFFKSILLLTILLTIHAVFLFVTGGETIGIPNRELAFDYLKAYYISVLPIFTFYTYAKLGYLNNVNLKCWIPIFFLVGVSIFYKYQAKELEIIFESGGDRVEVTNNAGYVMLNLIPCMLLFKKGWIQLVGISIAFMFMMFAMKRGAIIIGILVVLIYIYDKQKHFKFYYKVLFICLLAVMIIIMFGYLEDTLFQSDYFKGRLEGTLEGKTSGRGDLALVSLNYYFADANIFQKIFGSGLNGTVAAAGNYAHNDWVEILVTQGILGFGAYAFYWYNFYHLTKNKNISETTRFSLKLLFVIFVFRSFFSQSITDMHIFATSLLGLSICNGLKPLDDNK